MNQKIIVVLMSAIFLLVQSYNYEQHRKSKSDEAVNGNANKLIKYLTGPDKKEALDYNPDNQLI